MALGRKAAGAVLAVCAVWLAGCGEGLGECDTTMLGGDPFSGLPYAGQEVVAQKCSSGRCHSEAAMGDARVGAPGELDFDVVGSDDVAVSRNIARVVDWAEDMWAEIDSGTMPPAAPAGSGELSSADKEKVRNWLACGAPKIVSSATSATWESIWSAMQTQCVGCHATATTSGGNFALGTDACTSHANLVGPSLAGQPSIANTMCASSTTLVVPGNPMGSLLYLKVTGTQGTNNMCGSPMPLGSTMGLLDADRAPELVGLIETWIMNGAPKPAGCP